MTVKLGKNYRLKVGDGGTTETFAQIAGEQQLSLKSSSENIDISSKDDGGIKSQTYGQRTVTISLSGVVKLPDTGLARLHAVLNTSPPNTNIEIVDISSGTPQIVYAANVGIGNESIGLDNGKDATYSYDLTLTGVPTVDELLGAG